MSDLICRKTMTRCQTPGMCAPHGGCSTSAEAARAALVERAVAPAPASGVPGTIGVKRYIPDGYTQPASRSGTGTHMVESRDGDYVLASDYDALAQRCQELEACIAGDHTNLVALLRVGQAQAERERDALRAEVETLREHADQLERQAAARQAGADGWQAVYDRGRADGVKFRLSELEQERRIAAELQAVALQLIKTYITEDSRDEQRAIACLARMRREVSQ